MPGKYISLENTFVYALVDPRSEDVMYVGKSNDPRSRLKEHIWQANLGLRDKPRFNGWLRELAQIGKVPKVLLLNTVSLENSQACERYWISFYRKRNPNLLNSRPSGEDRLRRRHSVLS